MLMLGLALALPALSSATGGATPDPTIFADFDFAAGSYKLGGVTTTDFTALPGYSSANPLVITPGVGLTTGAIDVITISGVAFPAAVTLIAWATPTTLTGQSGPMAISDGTTLNRLALTTAATTNLVTAVTTKAATTSTVATAVTSVIATPIIFVCTTDAAVVQITANGAVPVVSSNPATAANPASMSSIAVGRGSPTASANRYQGTIARLQILNYAMTPTQMQAVGPYP